MSMDERVRRQKVFTTQAVTAGATVTSGVFNVKNSVGNFSLINVLTGTGTAKINYTVCATKDGTFVAPNVDGQTTAGQIAASLTSGTWAGKFSPMLTPYMKITVTETGGANPVTVTTTLMFQ